MAALITTARAQQNAQLAQVNATLLSSLILAASTVLENRLGRTFTSTTYTEYLDGDNSSEIFVNHIPITTLTSVTIYDESGTAYVITLTDLEHYDDVGRLQFKSIVEDSDWDYFPDGYKNVKVVYIAGWAQASMPDDLQEGTVQLTLWLYNQGVSDTTKASESLGSYSYTAADLAALKLPGPVLLLCGHYKDRKP